MIHNGQLLYVFEMFNLQLNQIQRIKILYQTKIMKNLISSKCIGRLGDGS